MKIKGVNLGGWLLMEGYTLGGRNIPESEFKKNFLNIHGEKGLLEFEYLFRENFIKEEDFKNISEMSANTVRLPFHYSLLEKKPYSYSQEGFTSIKKIFTWANKYNIKIILDLHAACGSQNNDWHSDSFGQSLLWEKEEFRERTYSLWERISDIFKDESSLLGYDVLNEPVLGNLNINVLKKFYSTLIKRIRRVDKNNLIFLEGNNWATSIDFLKDLLADNIRVSIHSYQPLDYTFNFTPFYKFPGKIDKLKWDKRAIYKSLEPYFKFSQKNKVQILAGEFGINWRGGFWGELEWLESILCAFLEFNFDYTYWTYKSIANGVFPDGLYQYIPNKQWIRREGPVFGWENYYNLWGKEKGEIADFWQTKNFTPNEKVISLLKKFFINR